MYALALLLHLLLPWGLAIAEASAAQEGPVTVELPTLSARCILTGHGSSTAPRSGGPASVALDFFDRESGAPIATPAPRMWWQKRRGPTSEGELTCAERYRALISGSLAARADADFGGFTVATLNSDATIAFINPQIAWNRTQLENVVALPGRPFDWAEDSDGKLWAITVPDEAKIVMVDLAARKIAREISLSPGTRPERLASLPNGGFVVVLAGTREIMFLGRDLEPDARIDVGEGPHQLLVAEDAGVVLVTAARAGRISIVRTSDASLITSLDSGGMPLAVAWVSRRQVAMVATLHRDELLVIDPRQAEVVDRLPSRQGVIALATDPGGHYVFAANTLRSEVDVYDASTLRRVAVATVPTGPDQIGFTDRFAYIRSAGAIEVALLELAEIARITSQWSAGAGIELRVTRVPMFRAPPASAPLTLGVAPVMSKVPSAGAMLLASNADQLLYYYAEGLMAPMGTVSNYRRAPLGVRILDRALRFEREGRFVTQALLPPPGDYDVVVAIDNPSRLACAVVSIPGEGGTSRAPPREAPRITLVQSSQPAAAVPVTLVLRPDPPLDAEPALRFLLFRSSGTWQTRGGVFHDKTSRTLRIEALFPRAGLYKLMLSGGVFGDDYGNSSVLEIAVREPSPATVSPVPMRHARDER